MKINYYTNDDKKEELNLEDDESTEKFINSLLENNIQKINDSDSEQKIVDVLKTIINKQKNLNEQLKINETDFLKIENK